jgi:hypothetical protein
MNSHRLLVGLSGCLLLSVASNASAQDATTVAAPVGPTEAAEPAAPAAAPQSPQVKEATARFERGLTLYDDGDFEAALVEFNRAYGLAPTYKILYNIAKIERGKNDYSSALVHFTRYLEEGGAEVAPERREEVRKEIKVLKQRVGQVSITANVDGATVFIDDQPICGARMVDAGCVGTTPLRAPVIVNPGTRKITATKRGYQDADAQLTIAGGDQNVVKLELFDLKPPAEDTGPRNRAIVSWSVTGALAIGAGVMGVLALDKKKTYDDDREKPPCQNNLVNASACNTNTQDTLDSDKKQAKNFALVTDILTGAAVVGAGISIYFTVKAAGKSPSEADRHATLKSLKLSAGPGSAVFSGRF